jgi:hypothetical protein
VPLQTGLNPFVFVQRFDQPDLSRSFSCRRTTETNWPALIVHGSENFVARSREHAADLLCRQALIDVHTFELIERKASPILPIRPPAGAHWDAEFAESVADRMFSHSESSANLP